MFKTNECDRLLWKQNANKKDKLHVVIFVHRIIEQIDWPGGRAIAIANLFDVGKLVKSCWEAQVMLQSL